MGQNISTSTLYQLLFYSLIPSSLGQTLLALGTLGSNYINIFLGQGLSGAL